MAIFNWKVRFPDVALFKPTGPSITFTKTMGDFFEDMKTISVNIAQQVTPIGVAGELADSVEFEKDGILKAILRWTAPHARPVAEGSRPHWAPIRPIAEWAAIVLGDITAGKRVQHGIATRGTQPNDYPGKAKRRIENESRRVWPDKIADWVRRLRR